MAAQIVRAGDFAGDEPCRKQFDPLDRIAIRAPDTVHGRRKDIRERPRPSPRPCRSREGRNSEPTSAAIARCRLRSPPWPSPRGTRASATVRSVSNRPSRRDTEDVQTVADLHFLEIAEIGIELLQRLVFALALGDASIAVETDICDEIEDLLAEKPNAAWIATGRLVIFVDQRLQILQRPVALGPRQRRGQMVDDDSAGPALGLRALAGIVDDKGIEMRQAAEDRLGIAFLRRAPVPCRAAIPDCRACPCG